MKKTFAMLLASLLVMTAGAAQIVLPETQHEGGAEIAEAQMLDEYGPLGELIFKLDFEQNNYYDIAVNKTGTTVSYDISQNLWGGVAIVSDPLNETSNHAWRWNKSSQFAQFGVFFNREGTEFLGFNRPGRYTFKYDILYPVTDGLTDSNTQTMIWDRRNGAGHYNDAVKKPTPGVWYTNQKTLSSVPYNDAVAGGVTFTGGKGDKSSPVAHFWGFTVDERAAALSSGFATCYIDNVEVWFDADAYILYDFSKSAVKLADVSSAGTTAFDKDDLECVYTPGTALPELMAVGYEFVGWTEYPEDWESHMLYDTAEKGTHTLYPVFTEKADDVVSVALTSAAEYRCGTTNTFTFASSVDGVTWKADFGTTDLTAFTSATTNSASIYLGSTTKAGVVTVWAEKDGKKSNEVKVAVHTPTVVKPGYNIFNGTQTAAGFEDGFTWGMTNNASWYAASDAIYVSDVPSGITGNSSSKALRFDTGAVTYANMYWHIATEAGRDYYFGGKMFSTYGRNGNVNDNILYFRKGGAHQSFTVPLTTTMWSDFGEDFTDTAAVGKFWLQHYCAATATDGSVYLDDLMLVPYYKINYHYSDSYVLTMQTLFDGPGHIAASFEPELIDIPDASGKQIIGWNTEKNADAAMTSVPLDGADVDLYPVYGEESGEQTMLVAYTDFVDVIADGIDAFDDPFGAAVITDNGDGSFHVASNGCNGKITVGNLVIRFYGSKAWRPGVNTITGTDEPFGFDFSDAENNAFIPNGALTGLTGTHEVAFESETQFPFFHIGQIDPAVEPERPLAIGLSYKGDITSLWAMNGWAGNGRKYGTFFSGTGGAADTYHDVKYYGTQETETKYDTNYIYLEAAMRTAGDTFYADNVYVIPAYKVTYIDNADGTTVLASEYRLFDENGDLLTVMTPDYTLPGLEHAVSVSLEKDGDAVPYAPLEQKDITFYVTVDENAPTLINKVQLRMSDPCGLRFAAFVSDKQRAKADEYGFLVALKNSFAPDANDVCDYTQLTFAGAVDNKDQT